MSNAPPLLDPTTVVSKDPQVHSGALVFAGTRVPVDTLIDYVETGHTIDRFLAGYPSVARWQAEAALELAAQGRLGQYGIPRIVRRR